MDMLSPPSPIHVDYKQYRLLANGATGGVVSVRFVYVIATCTVSHHPLAGNPCTVGSAFSVDMSRMPEARQKEKIANSG